MKFIDLFRSFQKKESSVTRALTLWLPAGQGVSSKTDYASLAKEGFTQNSVAFSCVKEIASASAGVPWILFRKLPGGERREVSQHPLLDLLARPNPLQGKYELIESMVCHLYISGNTYMEAVGPTGGGPSGLPKELYVLRPDRMKVIPDAVHYVGGYEYTASGNRVEFPRDRILHLKLFNPLDDWYGLSPVQVAALAIDKLNSGDKWNASLLQNAAVPSGALTCKQRLTDDQFDRLKTEMRRQIQGVNNAREPLLLEQDLEWKELGISPKDMDWIEGLKMSALQVTQVFNVPPELVGLGPATYQNRKEARKALYTEVVCPFLNRLRDGLNNWLVPRFGDDLFLDYDKDGIEALSEDQEALWNRVNQCEFLTVNEKRHMVGFDDVPDGDRLSLNHYPNSGSESS
ncbi:MAG: phage portal protein [Nitrospinae bacterium CG22_combo_CG10-13_8_21_14_all_47_10]|nr:MAG: phage portal protein [Nitrospinae bacterium CG22_combo_CG10-13_8_21_14_all_47_10]